MKKLKTLKRIDWIAIIVAITVTVTALGAWAYLHDKTNQARTLKILERKQIELDVKLQELKKTQTDTKQLEEQKKELEKQLQAKREASEHNKAYAATLPPKPATAAPKRVSGSCEDWIRQAGITDVYYAKLLINGESNCRPNAINPSSNACGLPQSLPCSKMGCSLSDPICQLRWMDVYVKNRYTTWANAYNTWYSRNPHWY